ncbi:MAG TPA: circadian clock KaiB family protein, partial [Roseimicrobium sp.]|nr:circadian clock KaiB family protein [Roseimicrobium sp.]
MATHPNYRFLLYVADDSQNSVLAIANLNAICREHLPGHHEIKIIDVFKEPKRALADAVFMTPTLI